MNFSSIFIRRPVLAIVVNLLILLFGIIGFKFLGIREYPAIDPPIITVRTGYAGASAEVIETQITEPLEKAINGIDGVRTISSISSQGVSMITVEFNLNSDLEKAANDVRDKVSQAIRQLPADIDALPTVTKADASSDAIIAVSLKSNKRSILEVDDYAENILMERLQTIPGVSSIQVWGQKKYAMRLWLNIRKMAAFKITTADVQAALLRENIEAPAGKIFGATNEQIIQANAKLLNIDEFNNLIIKNDGINIIRFKDIGRAELSAENLETNLKVSGVPMIGLGIVPLPGANYIDITDELYKRLDVIKKELPKDYQLDIIFDNTKFIRKAIEEVEETLIIAIILVILVTYLFFRDWVVSLRPLLDMPVSLIGAFFIMYMLGFSVNVLTLLAIVLATGLVVDDGIVVTENIYKKIEDGEDSITASHKGSKEIFFAIISTSLTLAAVFMPVIFMQGFVGRLFREFGVVIAGAVIISAFVSLTLTPMLNAYLVRKAHSKSKFYIATEPFFRNLENGYTNYLRAFLNKKWLALVTIAACLGIILLCYNNVSSELAPLDDRGWLRFSTVAPEGTSFSYNDKFLDHLTKILDDSVSDSRLLLTVTSPGFAAGTINTGFGRMMLKDREQRKYSQQWWANRIAQMTKGMTEGKIFVSQEQTISAGGGPRGGLPVQFVIQATNFEKLKKFLPKFIEKAQKNPVFGGQVDCNLKFNKPQINITIKRDKARTLGVSVKDIIQTLQIGLSGTRLDYFNMNDKQYSIIAQIEPEYSANINDVGSLFVRSTSGQLIRLDNLINFEYTVNPPQLFKFNRYESATISAGLAPGKTIADGINEMKKIAQEVLEDSFSTALTGPSRDYAESSSNIGFALLLALILIYLLLSAQFESFVDPLIIMITVPLAFAGALLSLWYFNQTLNIFSEIGIIMLIGLVTKNGILIVEFSNQLKEQGLNKFDAVLKGAASRLRPILMTSLATVFGALPIAMSLGAASESRKGMGIVVVGGILFSLILTLFVIPAIYLYLSKKNIKQKTEMQYEEQ